MNIGSGSGISVLVTPAFVAALDDFMPFVEEKVAFSVPPSRLNGFASDTPPLGPAQTCSIDDVLDEMHIQMSERLRLVGDAPALLRCVGAGC